ncbi:HIT domain-containing protein [Bacillus haynesii]|uniref:HIT domain-containing protein n=1 Tax=Bacillus haynesii TaxID=1925021 RepID=UPI00227E79CB|nr:HIT domain-containing protein [Bacillus haynesii]MCY7966008.1 HIT domain-containing protein [Bacillus haynesii]MCY7990952.1 HIT domain-containing protein [Bacillus haynesii]MCY8391310.1 HIT domain-containing protein [Bacillus haynesii]MCY9213806.1 HIT domain-containing protein [Bacillus haynesii]MEC1577270.1 HIT domain-containing protein [Bacillus haynesii]
MNSEMDKCIFCEIVSRKISSFEVYKNDYVTAFLDINPVTCGHTLIIPNKHIERLDHINDPHLSNEIMDSLIKVPQILIHSGICDDYTILSDNGHFAQQEIKHLHFHVIPRHLNEKFEFKLNTDFTAAKKSNLFSIWKKIVGR